MNKRAVTGFSLIELLGVIFAAVIIVVAVVAGGRFLSTLFGGTKYSDSKNSFQALAYELERMVRTNDQFMTEKGVDYYISKELILVGYDYNRNGVHTDCSPDTEEASNKYCHGKPCLCLHINGNWDDFDDDSSADAPITECYEFNDNIIFLSPFDNSKKGGFGGTKKPFSPNYNNEQNYEDLFIYGDKCDGETLGATKLYLEKFVEKETGKVYFYLDFYTDQNIEKLRQREDSLKRKYDTVYKYDLCVNTKQCSECTGQPACEQANEDNKEYCKWETDKCIQGKDKYAPESAGSNK